MEKKIDPRGIMAPLVYFAITAFAAAAMLIIALVVWLAETLESATVATLIVGGFFSFVAWLIYVLAVRRSIDYIRDRLDTIYDVAFAARNAYRIASHLAHSFIDQFMRK